MRLLRKVVSWTVVAACVAPLYGCSFLDSFVPKRGETTDVIDRQQNLTIKDFKDIGIINKAASEANAKQERNITAVIGAPPIPDIAEVLAAPMPPKVANTKLVTLAVTDDVPLRDVLFELGRLANVDIEVGSGLDARGINLRATNRPFNEVIERISTLGNLRYSVNGSSIRVERDLPHAKNYSLDFLNIVRSSTSGYNISTNVISGGGGGASSGGSSGGSSSGGSSGSSGGGASSGFGSSGSNSAITASADSDLWSSFEASVNEILASSPEGEASVTGAAGAPATGAAAGAATGSGSVIINRQAGVMAVVGTERQHEMVQHFLTLMQRNASAQVLIEAKIVEVSLSDQFASGVDWNRVIGSVSSTRLGIGSYLPANPITNQALSTAGTGNPALTFGVEGGDLGAVLALTQVYGTTRTLSSPRLSAINNQQAVLTFAQNFVYFNCTFTPATTTAAVGSTTTNSGTDATLNCDQQTVPIGIIMSILPSINLDTQEVTLNVRPTLTRIAGQATNPQTSFLRSQLPATTPNPADVIPDITVPIIESREIDSITKIKSGGVMVIGGLMEDATRNTETGVPGVGEIPIFGNLFKSRNEDSTKRELIIFIKATIVNTDGSAHKTDKKVYDKFTTDPRPLFNQ